MVVELSSKGGIKSTKPSLTKNSRVSLSVTGIVACTPKEPVNKFMEKLVHEFVM